MTREEAHGEKGDRSLEKGGITRLVNDIYDDFESRVCSNCKHKSDSSLCSVGIVYDNTTDNTFGCNKFQGGSK